MTGPRQAIVLAAGHGTRMQPLSQRRPKPLIPLLNVPLLEHGLFHLRRAGVERVAINAFHLAEQLVEYVRGRPDDGLQLHVEVEHELLGTGGGLRNLLGWLSDGPCFVLASDVLATDFDLTALARHHARCGALATMTLVADADQGRYGAVEVDDQGRITDIVGLLGRPGNRSAVNGSAHLLERPVFELLPEGVSCLVRQGYIPALRQGLHCTAWFHRGPWRELGRPADLLAAQHAAFAGSFPVADELWAAGGRRAGPSLVHPRARVAPDARLRHGTVVGPAASVGAGAVLHGCLVLPGATVPAGLNARGAILDGAGQVLDARAEAPA